MGLKIRTDLALEAKESLDEDGSLNGVVFDEQTDGREVPVSAAFSQPA